ncbi:MAG: TolB family protein [Candidatus Hodarchaeota archaeon]
MRTITKLLSLVILFLICCQKQPTKATLDQFPNNEKVDINFNIQIPSELQPFVFYARAQVTASDIDTIKIELKVTPTHVEGVIKNIPAGKNRFFEIFVYNQDSIFTYYGSKYADVFAGRVTQVEIILQPVIDTGTVHIIGYFGTPKKEKIIYSTFDSQPPYDDGEIYMINPDGTNTIQLTNNPGADYHPQISPSGDKIVFVRNLDPQGLDSHIFIMNTDGTDQTQLTFPPVREDSPWFSPEGDRIVFRKRTQSGGSNIFIMNVDGSGSVNITNDRIDVLHPIWANDNYIYFVTHGNDYKIWRIRPDGSDLSAVSSFQVGAHERVIFTSDMEYIFYDSYNYPNQIVKSAFPLFTDSIAITSGDDTGGFCLSPDNSKIIYSQGSHATGYYLYIKDLNTNRIKSLGIRAIHMDWKEISE